MKKAQLLFWLTLLTFAAVAVSAAYAGTVTGTLQGPSGLPISNGTLAFNLQQAGLIVGTGSVVPLTASCYTSTDGSVVGIFNPTAQVISSINYGSGTLPGGIYYIEDTFYSGSQETLPSPELRIQLTGAGTLTISPPVSFPPNATGMRVYIGTSSGAEQLQGQTTSATAQLSQAVPLASGSAPPATNSSICSIAFNDTIIPYSGYNVSLTSSSGNSYPGWPQAWQLNGGLNGTVNISAGAPLWNGTIIYPQPIVAQPLNHGPQSISGLLNMSGYNVVGVGALGVGTNTPSWSIDVENGAINSSAGYLYAGGAGSSGQCLVSNGTAFVPGTCFTPGSTFYQTAQSNGTVQAQELAYNFSSAFALTDSPGTATNVDLAPSGVTAGTYTSPTVTVNAKGQVTAASNGTSGQLETLLITSGICTTPTSDAGGGCTTGTFTWPSSFADANYALTCTGENPTGAAQVALYLYWTTKTATGFSLTLQKGQGNSAGSGTFPEIDCVGIHP